MMTIMSMDDLMKMHLSAAVFSVTRSFDRSLVRPRLAAACLLFAVVGMCHKFFCVTVFFLEVCSELGFRFRALFGK